MQTVMMDAKFVATYLRARGIKATYECDAPGGRSTIWVFPCEGLNAELRKVLGDRWSSRRQRNGSVEISWRR